MDARTRGRRATIVVFMAALLAPAIAVGLSPQLRESVAAVVADPGDWPEQSNRLRAATPLWDGAVSAHATLLYELGASADEGVGVVGRDGWMFLGDVQNANFYQALGRRQFSDEEIDAWSSVVTDQRTWLANRGIPLVVAVAPAKWSVYPDRLPAWTDEVRGPTVLDQVLAARPDLGLVDLRPALRDARATADTYSRLNSHWTGFGGYVGWQSIADAVDHALPGADARAPALEGVRTVPDGVNEFDAMLGVRAPNPWTVADLAEPLPDVQVVEDNGDLVTVPGDRETDLLDLPRTTRNAAAGNDLTVLVLRDSMGDAISPYLQAAFGTTVQVRHSIDAPQDAPNIQALVERVQPDLVLVEMAERHLNSGLPDREAWAAANAYDRAQDGPGAPVTVAGTLEDGVELDVGADAAADLVLRVALDAQGSGSLRITGPDGTVRDVRVARGANVLFARVPSGPGEVPTRLALGEGSSSAELTSVDVRVAG